MVEIEKTTRMVELCVPRSVLRNVVTGNRRAIMAGGYHGDTDKLEYLIRSGADKHDAAMGDGYGADCG